LYANEKGKGVGKMRVMTTFDEYLKLPQLKRRKMAIEWCFRLLSVNLDQISEKCFNRLVREYESIVAYPEILHGGRYIFHDEDDVKAVFKGYQEIARKFIDAVREVSPGKSLRPVECDVSRSLKVSSTRAGTISIYHRIDHEFEFSFAWHLARLLDGRKFDDVVCVCPYCDHYFPTLTRHKRKYCKRICATKDKQRKRRGENSDREKRINRLRTKFSRTKERYHTDKARKKELNRYLEKHPYALDEIPQNIRDFIRK
jgi:hypothetical protein